MYNVIGGAHNRSFRVIWMLEELGVPYQRTDAAPHDEVVSPHTPLGKLPVLLLDGRPMTDSVAILTFLADHHGRFTHPAGTYERARQDGVTQQVVDEIEGLIWMAARHTFVLPPELRIKDIKASLRWEFERNIRKLSTRLSGPFISGGEMTVPDIITTHCLDWAQVARFPVEDPQLLAYAERMRARPAYQAAMASEHELTGAALRR